MRHGGLSAARHPTLSVPLACAAATLIVWVSAFARGQASTKARPSVVLVIHSAWAMVLNSESPTFALYDDRTVIFWRREKNGGEYVYAQLAPPEAQQIIGRVNLSDLELCREQYSLSDATDQPTSELFVRRPDGTYKRIAIYGQLDEAPGANNDERRLPGSLWDTFRLLETYENADAMPWMPDFVEVMLWPYGYAPDKDMIWPSAWPGLNDPRTVKRGRNSYSLFIERSHYKELSAFLSRRREKQAIRIDGKKWAVSVRFPFPRDGEWAHTSGRGKSSP